MAAPPVRLASRACPEWVANLGAQRNDRGGTPGAGPDDQSSLAARAAGDCCPARPGRRGGRSRCDLARLPLVHYRQWDWWLGARSSSREDLRGPSPRAELVQHARAGCYGGRDPRCAGGGPRERVAVVPECGGRDGLGAGHLDRDGGRSSAHRFLGSGGVWRAHPALIFRTLHSAGAVPGLLSSSLMPLCRVRAGRPT